MLAQLRESVSPIALLSVPKFGFGKIVGESHISGMTTKGFKSETVPIYEGTGSLVTRYRYFSYTATYMLNGCVTSVTASLAPRTQPVLPGHI